MLTIDNPLHLSPFNRREPIPWMHVAPEDEAHCESCDEADDEAHQAFTATGAPSMAIKST